MNWICNIMLLLYTAAVSGGMLSLIWIVSCRILQRSGNTCRIYALLKCVISGYLLPFAALFQWNGTDASDRLPHTISGCIREHMGILFGIWCAGMAVSMAIQFFQWSCLKRILRVKIPARQEERMLLAQLLQRMGIRKKVHIYKCYGILSPCIYGIFQTRIFLPAASLERGSLEMMLLHELTHLKQRDTLWKPILVLLTSIFWFTPFSWFVAKQMVRWAEASCDERCCKCCSPRRYFGMMGELLIKNGNPQSQYVSRWTEGAGDFSWRVERIMRGGKRTYEAADHFHDSE